jgi:hypothetical protein
MCGTCRLESDDYSPEEAKNDMKTVQTSSNSDTEHVDACALIDALFPD